MRSDPVRATLALIMNLSSASQSGCLEYRVKGEEDSGQVDADPSTDSGEAPTDSTDTAETADTAPDSGMGQEIDTSDTDTGTDTPTGCHSVLVYSTEGSTGSSSYIGIFDGLEADAALEGWDVEVVERATDGPLTASLLVGRSQLWVLGTDRDFGTTLSDAEIAAGLHFGAAGGGLLLVAEHTDSSYSYTEDVNGLAEPLGVSFSGSVREGSDGAIRTIESVDPTLTAGVSELPVFTSVAELELTDDAVQPVFLLDGAPSMASRTDGVRAVFDRSWGGWRDLFRADGQQSTLVSNVVRFLEPCAVE